MRIMLCRDKFHAGVLRRRCPRAFATLSVVVVTGLLALSLALLLYQRRSASAEIMRPARIWSTLRLRQAVFERKIVQLVPEYASAAGVPGMPAERVSWKRLVEHAAAEAGLAAPGIAPELVESEDAVTDLPVAVRVDLLSVSSDDLLVLKDVSGGHLLPLLSHDKRYPDGARFRAEPWPDIHFRYAGGETVQMRRNAWLLHCRFTSGMHVSERRYRVLIDEIPAQLAMESMGRLNWSGSGIHASATAVELAGGVYAAKLDLSGLNLPRLSARKGFTVQNVTVAGAPVDGGPGGSGRLAQFDRDAGAAAGEWLRGSADAAWHPVSVAVNFDLANFVSPAAGMNFYDCVTYRDTPAAPAGMSRDRYMRGAVRCRTRLFITALDKDGLPAAVELETGNRSRTPVLLTGNPVVRALRLASGRPALELNLAVLAQDPAAAAVWGFSGPEATLAVNLDYLKPGVPKPALDRIPALPALVLARGADLSAWPEGVSIVSNTELIFRHSFNRRALTSGLFPPASVFAPVVRYGVGKDERPLQFKGAVSSPRSDDAGALLPAFERENGAAASSLASKARLADATDGAAPIHLMHWLVTLEQANR